MENKLSLEDVADLGGNKKDLTLVNEVEDDDEAIDVQPNFEEEPIKREEIQAFLDELGIADVLRQFDDDKAPIKLAARPLDDEEKTAIKEAKAAKKEASNKVKAEQRAAAAFASQSKQWWTEPLPARTYALCEAFEGRWYDHKSIADDATVLNDITADVKEKMQNFAQQLLSREIDLHRQWREKHKKSDTAWVKMVLTSGTTADRTAALTLLVQEAPVTSIGHLDTLISLAKKKSRREALGALDAVKQLLLSDLLPDSRRLRSFFERPVQTVQALCGGDEDERDRRLVLWMFEGELRRLVTDYIAGLETLTYDVLPVVKKKAIGAIFDLLAGKPEQEKRLLGALVNKLGDPDYKTAAHCSHLLTKLVLQHPLMKVAVVDEVERFLYRANISPKAQYYGVCFLTQLKLTASDQPFAARLINIYLSFFKAVVKRREVDSRMMSALLTGVNRAFPYAKVVKSQFTDQLTTLYQTVHASNFNTSLQALMLLYQATDTDMADRYYNALYRKLADPDLLTSSKQTLFLNLLYKSLLRDESDSRVKAFIKRLLQVCLHQQPTFICGALVLVSQLLGKKPCLVTTSKSAEEAADSDEEHYEDAPDEDDDMTGDRTDSDAAHLSTDSPVSASVSAAGSWLHRKRTLPDGGRYNTHARNPLYSHADTECAYELHLLLHHLHPSVALFAQAIVARQPISYSGDPLHDFTQIKFLDRFVYRNPKKTDADTAAPLRTPVNSQKFAQLSEANVAADEVFFHRFFSEKVRQKEEKAADSDADSVSDGEFDAFLDKYEHGLGVDKDDDLNFAGQMSKEAGLTADDLSDEEMSFGSDMDGEFDDVISDQEDEAEAGSSGAESEPDDEDEPAPRRKAVSRGTMDEMFADAEEFADLLETDNADAADDATTSEAFVNTDKSHAKQLKWEAKRMKEGGGAKGGDWRRKKAGPRRPAKRVHHASKTREQRGKKRARK